MSRIIQVCIIFIVAAFIVATGCIDQPITKTQSSTADETHCSVVVSMEKRSGYEEVQVKSNCDGARRFVVQLREYSGNVVSGEPIAIIPLIKQGETGEDKVYVGTNTAQIVGVVEKIGDGFTPVKYSMMPKATLTTAPVKVGSPADLAFLQAALGYLNGEKTILDVKNAGEPDSKYLKAAREHLFNYDEQIADKNSDGRTRTAAQQRAQDQLAAFKVAIDMFRDEP